MSRRAERAFLIVFAVFTALYMVWRIGWTIPTDHGALSIIFALILLVTEMFGVAEMGVHFTTCADRHSHLPDCPDWLPGQLPEVDVLVPTRGEPVELLERTLRGCLKMEYDDPAKIHVFLCDDADRQEMRELASKLGAGYFSRKNGRDAKAGNLNAALLKTRSPLVAVFDADMCPEPEFLLRTAPYFLAGPGKHGQQSLSGKIGFVQTPQSFRTPDLFQRAFRCEDLIPNEQDFFYLNLEPARNKLNSVIFGGSNTLLSRAALNAVGGFVTGTLTEDFATGIEIQKRGYTCYAIPEALASGLCPESLTGMIKQRSRWARGCIQSGRKTRLLRGRGLNLRQRLSYLSAVSYWYAPIKRLVYIMAPLMYAVFGVTVMRCDFRQMILFWLPMYLMALIGIRLFSDGIRSARWSDIYELCLFPFLLLPVLGETLGISRREFVVTDKSGKKGWSFRYTLPFLALIALSVLGIVNTVRLMAAEQTTIYLLLLFWLVFNMYELIFALVFVCACRRLPEGEERKGWVHALPRRGSLRTSLLYIFFKVLFGGKKEREVK